MFMFLVVTSILLFCVNALYKWYLYKKKFDECLKNIPQTKGYPILGNALEFSTTLDIIPALLRLQEQNGLTFRHDVGPFTKFIFTADPEFIEFILTSNVILDKSHGYKFLFNWLRNGLLTSPGHLWKNQRKMLNPTFSFSILDNFIPTFESNADALIEVLNTHVGEEFNIYEYIMYCTLDVICETTMGVSINALKERKNSQYANYAHFYMSMIVERSFSFWKQFDCLYQFSNDYKKEVVAVKHLHELTNRVIQQRKELFKMSKKENSKKEDDFGIKKRQTFLDLLIELSIVNGGDLTDEEIRQQVDTFMFAGHDTTATGIGYTLYHLSKHPDIQEKLYKEILEIEESKNGNLTHQHLQSMKYMEMVIKESQRITPSIHLIGRELNEDVKFKEHIFPKGLQFAVFTYGAHRNKKYFPDPEKFDPDRFTPENIASRPTYSYVAFSNGPRNCIGQKFAMFEMKVVLYKILINYKLHAVPNFKLILEGSAVMKSKDGIMVKLEKRQM